VTIVGIDTALPVTAACVLRADGEAFKTEPPAPGRLLGPPDHSAELLPALAALLERAGVGWREVDSLAVGIGPGTFTGLRIGIATARGLAQALGIGLRPVPSLAALARGLAESPGAGERPLLALVDARRGQVFAALYRAASPLEPEWGPLAIAPPELLERVASSSERPLAAGDWALESRANLEAAGVEVPPDDAELHAVSALQVCRLGSLIEPISPDRVTPIYVRMPDAEINRRDAVG
jgi:tRNA threonylcarbamoyladenosine biosynthesis protein TsaB